MSKIFVGMPTYDNKVYSFVCENLIELSLEVRKRNDTLAIAYPSSPFLSLSRNMIMEDAIQGGFDWILMWDSDIQVPDGGKFIYKMVETAYKYDAVITGLLCRLKLPEKIEFACGIKAEGGYERLKKAPLNPQEVDVMGAGITLLKVNWIKKNLTQPYYEFQDGKGLNGPTILPEDWRFCEKVKEKGGKIIVEPMIETIHYGQGMWASTN